jgi:hypothetical protein
MVKRLKRKEFKYIELFTNTVAKDSLMSINEKVSKIMQVMVL